MNPSDLNQFALHPFRGSVRAQNFDIDSVGEV